MKNATIAWVLVIVFFATSVLFACLYLSERHTLQRTQTALDMTEKSEAELRSNVQAAITQSDKQETQTAAQDRFNSICGIYYCEVENLSVNQVDLRSDGTAVFFVRTSNAGEIPRPAKNWQLNGNVVTAANQNFTIEQDDLIDSRGNRWIHTR
jgi:hypothetical protein